VSTAIDLETEDSSFNKKNIGGKRGGPLCSQAGNGIVRLGAYPKKKKKAPFLKS